MCVWCGCGRDWVLWMDVIPCVCGCMQSGNSLGVDGAKALVPALSEMKMLQSLNLECKWKWCVCEVRDCFCKWQGSEGMSARVWDCIRVFVCYVCDLWDWMSVVNGCDTCVVACNQGIKLEWREQRRWCLLWARWRCCRVWIFNVSGSDVCVCVCVFV